MKKHLSTFILVWMLYGMCISCQERPNHTTRSDRLARWTEDRVNAWYKDQEWPVGANFIPSYAINQLEMWQEDTFDILKIEEELAWAHDLGFNTMRVFLHNLLWEQDATGFVERIKKYLEVADKYQIKTMFVLFDDVWNPYPKLGKQPKPKPHVHNSGWVQSPGRNILVDPSQHKNLEPYVKGILCSFKDDERVLLWDLYNEPGNNNGISYSKLEPDNKELHSLNLVKKVYRWAREADPSQPLSLDIWTSVNKTLEEMDAIDRFAFENSDVINFHCYANKTATTKMVERLSAANRPLFCTEYMARSIGSTFQDILPIFKKYKVAAYNWGFVSGKSQTIYPWESWHKEFVSAPKLWFHDILRNDGTPFSDEEVTFLPHMIKDGQGHQNTQKVIQIDADLTDWGKHNYLHGLTDPWDSKTKDQTQFDFTTTAEHFYFYFKAMDSTPTKITYVNERSLLPADRVELFFSSDKELTEYYGAEMSPKGEVLDFKASFPRNIDHGWDFETLTLATKKIEGGYLLEGSISRKELALFGIQDEFYLGVFRADFHEGKKVNWFTKNIPDSPKPDFHIPSAFGKIILSE